MSDIPLFLSTSENCSNILPIEFRLMNGYVHRLFLSRKEEDISVSFPTDIPYSYKEGVITIDLSEKDGNYSFSFTIISSSLDYHQTYHVVTEEKITLESLCGKYRSLKNILSFAENQKGSFFFQRWLVKKTLYFDVLSFDPLLHEIKVKVRNESLEKQYFLSLKYDAIQDEIELSLYSEEYSLDDSLSREIIKRAMFSRIKEQE